MTAVALNLSSARILEVERTATKDVARARTRVGIGANLLGQCIDVLGSFFVRRGNRRLSDTLMRLKGLVALVSDLDPNRVLDQNQAVAQALSELQEAVADLHGFSLKARNEIKLRRSNEAFGECVELCAALREVVAELKRVVADHDSKATMGDDARRLIADLKRTDDVPAGRYNDIAAAMSGVPQRERRGAR